MASPPPRNRRWMCPNHIEPPKRRKKRDAVAIDVSDPFAYNDGDIEIMDDMHTAYPFTSQSAHHAGGIYRVPEAMILRDFVERCQRSNISEQLGTQRPTRAASKGHFDLLIAAMMATEGIRDREDSSDQEYEAVQDALQSRLSQPEERQLYQQYRAFQRALIENGAVESVRQWMSA
ncbi:hypothetical protein BGZ68_002967 [Mortierella alpina]|nr:hypothetical protein BGZ68_002967 [Mortierella alpina]